MTDNQHQEGELFGQMLEIPDTYQNITRDWIRQVFDHNPKVNGIHMAITHPMAIQFLGLGATPVTSVFIEKETNKLITESTGVLTMTRNNFMMSPKGTNEVKQL